MHDTHPHQSNHIAAVPPSSSLELSNRLADSKLYLVSLVNQQVSSWQQLASYKRQILANPIDCSMTIPTTPTDAHPSSHPNTHKQPLQSRKNAHSGVARDPSNQLKPIIAHGEIPYHADAACY